MQRRTFIKLSSLSLVPLLQYCRTGRRPEATRFGREYDVTVHSDLSTGHILRVSHDYPVKEKLSTETVIVGGGIAGLSAGCSLKGRDFMLFELSSNLGGSSGSYQFQGLDFAQGAHYDLAYPSNYGEATLALLESLDIIGFDSLSGFWNFKDTQYLIDPDRETRCWDQGQIRKGMLPASEVTRIMLQLMEPFKDEMIMPTRLINPKYHNLNSITFQDWLSQNMSLSDPLIRSLDYQMRDDYGGTAREVSALAGIHYFMCRPYYTDDVPLFSPPQGNAYFVNKMARTIGSDHIRTGHLVSSIRPEQEGFTVEVIDVKEGVKRQVSARKVIYAGQKYALPYVYPEARGLFDENTYAPWVVVNLVVKPGNEPMPIWQNEMLGGPHGFLGFVNSHAQANSSDERQVLTGYFCLRPEERHLLVSEGDFAQQLAQETVLWVGNFFGTPIEDRVEKVFVKIMGHAMPVPVPGYLLNDRNRNRKNPDIAYAGVDNGRLPLLFEALDSGLEAAKALQLPV